MAARKKRTKAEIAHQDPVPDPIASPELEASVASLVASTGVTRWSLAEVRVQEQVVHDLMVQGMKATQIHRAMQADARRPEIRTIKLRRVQALYERIKERWAEEGKAGMAVAKQASIFRLHQLRQWALGERDQVTGKWITRPNFTALLRAEDLLIRLEGTAAPIAISVDQTYTQAMLQVTANLTGEQGAELLEEAREQARLAKLARQLLPAITVAGADVKE